MPRRSMLLIVPLSVAALATLAGCGGEEPLSRAEYVKQADAICTKTNARDRELPDAGDINSIAELERITTQKRQLAEQQIKEVKALEPPDEIADDVDALNKLSEDQLPKLDEVVEAAKEKDNVKIRQLATDLVEVAGQVRAKTKAIGFEVCGKR
ncbi:MAG: hypothetical protein M3417_04785 [Actinomycetota bacterium]|nr:hypothetical protein [Actinomycetota bacterium]